MSSPRQQRPAIQSTFPGDSRPRRSRSWARRILAGALGALLMVAGLGYYWATRPERIRRWCEQYLSNLAGGEARIERVEFSPRSGLHLQELTIAAFDRPGADRGAFSPEDRRLLTCRDVHVKFRPLAALSGGAPFDEIVFTGPECDIVRNVDSGRTNLQLLTPRRTSTSSSERRPPAPIRVRDATVRIWDIDKGRRRLAERFSLDASGAPDADLLAAYVVEWRSTDKRELSGRFVWNVATGSVWTQEGVLPWVSVKTVCWAVGPNYPGLEYWTDRLRIKGLLGLERLAALPRPGFPLSRLVLNIKDGSFSVPLDEIEAGMPDDQRFLRFENVNGSVAIDPDLASITLAAQLDGHDCRLVASLHGSVSSMTDVRAAAASVTISCPSFQFPSVAADAPARERRFVEKWSKLRDFYRDFDPHGSVGLTITLEKAKGIDAGLRLKQGVVTARGCDAMYRSCPYRLHGITGEVHFAADGVFLRGLTGFNGSGRVTVDGRLEDPSYYTGLRLDVTAFAVPINDQLRGAVAAKYRSLWDQFNPIGLCDIEAHMNRARGSQDAPKPWTWSMRARLEDTTASFVGFDYPVEHLTGQVAFESDRIEFRSLRGDNRGASVVIDGFAALAGEERDTELRLAAEGIGFDERLLSAMPRSAGDVLRLFRPEGEASLLGRLYRDRESGGTAYDLTAQAAADRVTYRQSPVEVHDVSGRLELTPGRVRLAELRGRLGRAVLTAGGEFAFVEGGMNTRLSVSGQDLLLEPSLLAILPRQVAELCPTTGVSGVVDVDLRLHIPPFDGSRVDTDYTITVTSKGLDGCYRPFPLPLTDVRGTVTITPGVVRLSGMSARYNEGLIELDGDVQFEEKTTIGRFQLAAEGIRFDPSFKAALPWRLRRLYNNLRPAGRFDLDLENFVYRSGPDGEAWEFGGQLRFTDGSLSLGVPAEHLSGHLRGEGEVRGPGSDFALRGQLHADYGELSGYAVTDFDARLDHSTAESRLTIDNAVGTFYGGDVSGFAEIRYSNSGAEYNLDAVVKNADLGDFLNRDRSPESAPIEVSGTMDGALYLRGKSGDLGSRVGGGRLQVTNGNLYRLPLLLAILDGSSLSVPQEQAIRNAWAEFYIDGDRMEISKLELLGTVVALTGNGFVTLSSRLLDLSLILVGAQDWHDVPVLETVNEMITGAGRELVEIRVTGTPEDPQIAARPFRGLANTVKTLFNPKKKR